MSQESLKNLEIFERFEVLLNLLPPFCRQLLDDYRLPCWVSRTETEQAESVDMRHKAARLYQQLWYTEDQEGRDTVTCPGLLGVSTATLAAARDCNQAKDEFKHAVLALKNHNKAQTDHLLETLHKRHHAVAQTMQRMGAARLNLKQAYRHITLLERRPLKVGFTWSKQGRTIQRTSVAEARRLLERRTETVHTRQALEKLSHLSINEPLARIRPVRPHLRANIVFENDERRLVQTPLPVLIPLHPDEPLPDFVPIPPEPVGSQRLRRSDVRIEDEPFIALLNIHRYKARYRELE